MASSIKNQNDYERAKTAYITGNYEEAASIIEKLAESSPSDPEILLLRGHIYCYFQEFDQAREQYNLVIENTDSAEYIDCANSGLETVRQWEETGAGISEALEEEEMVTTGTQDWSPTDLAAPETEEATGILSEDEPSQGEADEDEPTHALNNSLDDPFSDDSIDEPTEASESPFGDLSEDEITAISALDDDDDDEPLTDLKDTGFSPSQNLDSTHRQVATEISNSQRTNLDDDDDPDTANEDEETNTLLYADSDFSDQEEGDSTDALAQEEFDFMGEDFITDDDEEDEGEVENTFGHNRMDNTKNDQETRDSTEEEATGISSQGFNSAPDEAEVNTSLADMEEETPQLDHDDVETGHLEAPPQSLSSEKASPPTPTAEETNANQALFTTSNQEGAGLFSSTASQQGTNDLSFDGEGESNEPIVEQEQGLLAFLDNASLAKKQQIFAGAVGVASAVVVALGSFGISSFGENKPGFFGNLVKSSALGLVGGVGSGAVTWVMGGLVVKQVKRSTGDLQAQLYAVQQGNLEAKATVYSQDEFGQLATGFNQMTRVVSTTTKEAQRKAQEQEQAKEDLQRQVIRLLDDVEGAARGDLTVQAEVSADVLGAVADAFNLTIRNLRTIVQQVKEAARQVNEGAAESSSFARGLSEDALRQAEELAVSLNSSQMMTESIQRVADNAKEAESVARTASETALKGGEAVDSTVAGILQIRETVAQSTRKVKRLAESSQEISKIVSVISQIATRTNNLALNASIEAARAGEAGRGFAVIADEVRQLADRSTKSLREIEKIVLQIQSETSSVMIAMEEGTQQVIEGTERAEQAKNALEDIIQVSNRIDSLVESITADTVEQSETAQSVAQVMQSVEMTAQGTSQESQQVSTALQNLVSLAGDLLASVERFRVNPEDELKS